MKKEEFIALAQRYHAGKCSIEEQNLYEKKYDEFMNDESLAPLWDEKKKENIKSKILLGIDLKRYEKKRERIRLNYRMAWRVAASLLLMVGIGLTSYFLGGEEIEVKNLTKNTSEGNRAIVTLSDGSVVHLNSKSKLSYPARFSGSTREIFLEGEAFFDVQEDPERSFIVRSGDVVITVLGTSFNVREFNQGQVEVTVAKGKVKVAANATGKEVLLIKGQQATYAGASSDIITQEVNPMWYTTWISRSLEFNMMPFSEVVEILQRTYNTEIRIQDPGANACLIRGKYENERLINVLDGLKFVVNFDYQVADDDVIIIDGKGCNN